MQISITARHIDLEESFKIYINDKLQKLSKYNNKAEEARVVFTHEKFNYITEIILTGKRFRMTAKKKDENLRASFDKTATNAEKQLKRFRAKVKDHHVARIFGNIRRFSFKKTDLAQDAPEIIKSDTAPKKPMSPEEAAMELDVFKKEFLIFRNAETDEVNVIYKRKDGNYGLVEA